MPTPLSARLLLALSLAVGCASGGRDPADASSGVPSGGEGSDQQPDPAGGGGPGGTPGSGAAPSKILPPGPWTEAAAGLDGGQLSNVVYDPTNPKLAYVATFGGGVFKSIDGGATWSASDAGLGESVCVKQVYVHPAATSSLFASAATCERRAYTTARTFDLYRSMNAGLTWDKVTPSGVLDARGEFVTFASKASASVVFVRSASQLWKSVDGGATFAPRNVPAGARHFLAAAVDSMQPDVVFASIDVGYQVPFRTVRSADGGVTWTALAVPASSSVTAMWFSPADRSLWAAVVPWALGLTELWVSKDDGATWQKRLGSQPCVSGLLALAPSNGQRLYSASGSSFCRTNDQWTTPETVPMPLLTQSGTYVADLAVSPTNADELLVAAFDLHRSVDAGQTMVESQTGITNREVEAVAIAPSNEQIVYASGRGRVFRSGDAARTWGRRGGGLPADFVVTTLAVHPLDPSVVYAGGAVNRSAYAALVYKSIDGGTTFQSLDGGAMPWPPIAAIAVDASNPSHVTVLGGQELRVSTNDGLTWGRSPLPIAQIATRLVVHPTQPSTVVVVQTRHEGTIALRSSDAGLTFSSWTVPDKTEDVAFDAVAPSTAYACGADGPKVSIDGGLSWSSALVGLVSQTPEPIECRRLFQTLTGGRLYMVDNQGALWTTKNGATSWTRTKGTTTFPGGTPLATFGEQGILTAAVDGKNPDVVYLGLRGSVGIAKTTTGGL